MDGLNNYLLQELGAAYAKIDMLLKWNARYRKDNLTLTRQNEWMADQWDAEHDENISLRNSIADLNRQIRQLNAILDLQNDTTEEASESEEQSPMSDFSVSGDEMWP